MILLEYLFAYLTGRLNSPAFVSRIRLKEIRKTITSGSSRRFFKIRNGRDYLSPGLGQYFVDFYLSVAPLKIFLQNVKPGNFLTRACLEASVNPKQAQLLRSFGEDEIIKSFETNSFEVANEQIHQDLDYFISSLSPSVVDSVDLLYSSFIALKDLTQFNFEGFLTLFGVNVQISSSSVVPEVPQSLNVDAYAALDYLKDIVYLIDSFEAPSDWESFSKVLEIYFPESQVIKRRSWEDLAEKISFIKKTQILHNIISWLMQNAFYHENTSFKLYRVCNSYKNRLKIDVHKQTENLKVKRINDRLVLILPSLFGVQQLSHEDHYYLQNYTDQASVRFGKFAGDIFYVYAFSLLCVATFLEEIAKKELKEFVDLLVIKGAWISLQASRDFADNYHAIISISRDLEKFDQLLSENGSYGRRVSNLIHRAQADKNSIEVLLQVVNDINSQALIILRKFASFLEDFQRCFSAVCQEYQSSSMAGGLRKVSLTQISNWAELEIECQRSQKNLSLGLNLADQKLLILKKSMQIFLEG